MSLEVQQGCWAGRLNGADSSLQLQAAWQLARGWLQVPRKAAGSLPHRSVYNATAEGEGRKEFIPQGLGVDQAVRDSAYQQNRLVLSCLP